MQFDSELPADLSEVLAAWRAYVGAAASGTGL
jgi:hypothetical protein